VIVGGVCCGLVLLLAMGGAGRELLLRGGALLCGVLR
jgi:hypothetical protein